MWVTSEVDLSDLHNGTTPFNINLSNKPSPKLKM